MVKRFRSLLLTLLLAGTAVCNSAWAGSGHRHGYHHGHGHRHGHHHGHVGVYIAPSIGWGWRYSAPYPYTPYAYSPYPYYAPYPAYPSYYYPPYPTVNAMPSAPSSYIEQSPAYGQSARPAQTAPADWYYCKKPEGYYPHVQRCPGGWQRVPAEPPQ